MWMNNVCHIRQIRPQFQFIGIVNEYNLVYLCTQINEA